MMTIFLYLIITLQCSRHSTLRKNTKQTFILLLVPPRSSCSKYAMRGTRGLIWWKDEGQSEINFSLYGTYWSFEKLNFTFIICILYYGEGRVIVFNATFNNILVILWRSVLLVEETGIPVENHDLPQVTDKLYHRMMFIEYTSSKWDSTSQR